MNGAIKRRRSRQREDYDPWFEMSENVALLEQATENNQRQIGELAATTNKSITDLAQTTNRQFREVTTLIERSGAENKTDIKTLSAEFSNTRKTNWPLVISIVIAAGMFVTGAYTISDLQTKVTMAPIAAKAEVSEKDRAEIHLSVSANKEEISRVNLNQKMVETKLAEIETQFRASDQFRNVQFAEMQRTNNIILQIAQKKSVIEYPVYPYYFPSIAQPDGGSRNAQ